MNQETKICQNCKSEFVIEPEDFKFYEKMQVPPPPFCPECRFQRRLMFRNERSLYKRKCDLCGKEIITAYSPDKPYKVYCNPCWWSDNWDVLGYGQEYNPSRTFFEQFRALQFKVPYPNLIMDHPTLINSEYTNHSGHLKNCYLIYNADICENVHYAEILANDKDSMDSTMLGESELCYQNINCGHCYKTFFSEDCNDCVEVYFSKACIGCSKCFGCINLRNKQYHIFNKPYTKEEYEQKLKEFLLDSHTGIENLKKEAIKFWQSIPHKFMHERHNVNVSGDYVFVSKNAKDMYQVRGIEDGKYCQWITTQPVKDVYDYTEWGNNAQRIYECITVGEFVDNVKFSYFGAFKHSMNVEYSSGCISSSDIFGCIGVRKKQYCILNKQYTKEGYIKLRERIIKDMDERPYVDSKGRVFKYGEFFPYDLSLFDYNESSADQYFYPLSKEKVLERGWRWYEGKPGEYKITMKKEDIPDSINDVQDSIVDEVIECAECQRPYRIIDRELALLRRFGLPIPRKCPNCRHKERLTRINPPRLWDRKCDRCGADIKTSYAPERPEKIYCAKCYQEEFV